MVRNLYGLLAGVKTRREPARVRLDTGHELEVSIQALGRGWFSAETTQGELHGVVVPFRSIVSLGAHVETTGQEPPENIGMHDIHIPLRNLCHLAKRVTLHGPNSRFQGVIVEAGADYLVFQSQSTQKVVIPYRAISWIAVT